MISVTGGDVGLRAEKKEETRRSILETTVARFRTVGFSRTRVQDVVRQLRISEATFFNYFPTKQSVLEAAADDLLARSIEQLRVSAAEDDRPVEERLAEISRAFASNFAGDREFASMLAEHTRFFVGGRSGRLRESHVVLTNLLAEGQRRGEVRNDVSAAQLAELFQGASLTTINGWLAAAEDQPLDELLRRTHSVLWTGSRAEPRPR
jgi:NADH:ubiquinone reductase (H+-translocating)